MTAAKIKTFIYYAVYAIICLILLILQSTGLMTLQIGTASALLILPATVYAGYYFKEFAGALFGFAAGALTDVYSSTLCFNTVALTVCGFVCGLLLSNLFNSNLAAAVVLDVGASFLYFFAKWMFIYVFRDPVPMYILLHYTLPSAVYTAAWGFLMFLALRPFFKRLPVVRRH